MSSIEHILAATEMADSSFKEIPGRVFLDTCVVNFVLDYGEQIHDGGEIPSGMSRRIVDDIAALRNIFATGQRAFWQLAISPQTYREISATKHPKRVYELERWFFDIWAYWREFLRLSEDFPSVGETEEIRVRLLSSGLLDILPDESDRALISEAVAYRCDAFCTRDWSTILKHRGELLDIQIKIFTPAEWWSSIRQWAALWL